MNGLRVWIIALAAAGCAGGDRGLPYDLAQFPLFEMTPEVQSQFETDDHRARMTFNYVRYADALVQGGDAIDAVVASDVRLNDLEPLGFTGRDGLKAFRRQRNNAFAYDRALIVAIRFPAEDVTDVDLCTERTEAGTGAKVTAVVHARDRWEGDRVVERWHSVDVLPAGSDCASVAGS